MTEFISRLLSRRILLLLVPLGLVGLVVAQSQVSEFATRTFVGVPTARVLPSGEVVHHDSWGPDPFESRPTWALLPGLNELWELEEASGQSANPGRGHLKRPEMDVELQLVESSDGDQTVRIDYADGSYYEGYIQPAFGGAVRQSIDIEFVSSKQPGVPQFVSDLDSPEHPLFIDQAAGGWPSFDEEVLEVVDDDTTIYQGTLQNNYVHEAVVDGEEVTFELIRIEYQVQQPRIVEIAIYTPAPRHPFVRNSIRILPWLSLVAIGLGLVALGATLLGIDHRSKLLAQQILQSLPGQTLIERWLRRSRYFRFVGGAFCALVYLGRHGGSKFVIDVVDLTFWTFVGVAIGGAVAELHLIRRPGDQSALADLQPRSRLDYSTARDRVAMTSVAITAAVLVVLRLTGLLSGSLYWSCLPLGIVLAAYGFQRVVASRRRPAVSGVLRDADNVLRFLASTRGFGRPATAAAAIALARAIFWNSAPSWLTWVALLVILTGIVWYATGSERRLPKLAGVRPAM